MKDTAGIKSMGSAGVIYSSRLDFVYKVYKS